MKTTEDDPLLTPMEATRRLGYRAQTPHTILRLIRDGDLRAYKINSRVIRIPESEVRRFLAESSTFDTSRMRK